MDQHIKQLSVQTLPDLAKLHLAVYNRELPLSFWANKYDTAFTGVMFIGFIAYQDELAIAFYGVIPCFLSIDGQTVLAAQSADTMTHPDYRNKGLFVQLARLTFNLCQKNNIRLIFGFPNQNSLPNFINKLGFEQPETMSCFIISVKAMPWARLAGKNRLLKKWHQRYQHYILRDYHIAQPGLTNSDLNAGYDGVLRTQAYLNYKAYSPTQVIEINEQLLWIKLGSSLVIGDLVLSNLPFDDTMKQLRQLARRLGLTQIQFHSSTGTHLHTLFAQRYPAISSFPVIFKRLDPSIKIDRLKFTFADIDIF